MAKTEAEISAEISKKHLSSMDAELEAFQKELENEPKKAADPVVAIDDEKTNVADPYAAFRSPDFSVKKAAADDSGIVGAKVIPVDKKPVVSAEKEKGSEATEKSVGAEKAESAESGDAKKGEPKDGEKREQKDPLLEKLEDARKDFADLEFRDRQKWGPLKKFFSLRGDRESPEVGDARAKHKEALQAYVDAKITELEGSGKKGAELKKEMADLYTLVNYKEFLNLYDVRTEAKMDYLAEKEGKGDSKMERGWNWIKSKSAKLADAYDKKVPGVVKLGMAGAVFATGAVGLIAAKRTWGAFMMLSVGGMKADKIAQKYDRAKNWHEKNKFASGMIKKEGNVDFEKLRGALHGKVDDIDGRYRKYIKRSGINKCIALASGIILGCSATAAAMDYLSSETIPSNELVGKIFGSGGPRLENPTTDSFIRPDASKIPSPFEQNIHDGPLATSGAREVAGGALGVNSDSLEAIGAAKGAAEGIAANHLEVPIGSGQSIESVLIKTLEARGVENPGAVAHRMVLEYTDSHDLTVDKLSHIKSANFDIESGGKNGFQIKDLKFDALRSHLGHGGGHVGVGGVDQVEPTASYTEMHVPAEGQNINQEVLKQAFENEANSGNPYPAQAHDAYDNLRETNKAWEAASTRHVSPPSGSFLHDDSIPNLDRVTDLHNPDAGHVTELATKREAYANMVQELGAKSYSFKEIGGSVIKGMSGNKIDTWRQIKDLSYNDAINQPEAKTGILKTLAKLKGVLGEDAIKPLNGGQEKMGSMVTRLTKTAIEKGGK